MKRAGAQSERGRGAPRRVTASVAGVPELLHAIRFAAEKHRNDRRKGAAAVPYINHPIAVAEQLAAEGFAQDPELLMAAVLHDVVEDTDTSDAELAATFGPRVAGIVREVTDDKSLPRRERRARVVQSIAAHSREARLVKLSDLIANVYDVIHLPPLWSEQQRIDYLDWAEDVVNGLAGTHPGLERRFAALLLEARGRTG